MTSKKIWTWLLVIVWALLVNVCNVWLIRPLVADFAVYGVIIIFGIAVLWLTSIPKRFMRRWLVFTMFALLLGDGMSEIMGQSLLRRVAFGLAMIVGLTVLAWLVSKWKYRYFIGSAVVLGLANMALPFDEWPLLTHFTVVYRNQVPMQTTDIPALPLVPVQTAGGTAVLTLKNIPETQTDVESDAQNAVDSPDALENVLRNYQHRYALEQLVQLNGKIQLRTLPKAQLSLVDPLDFTTTFFPFLRAHWMANGDETIQYVTPAQQPSVLMNVINSAGYLPSNFSALGQSTMSQELADWQSYLNEQGVKPSSDGFQIKGGELSGAFEGQPVAIATQAYRVVGSGSFTKPGAHELLLQGENVLQVVSLDQKQVVSTYYGKPDMPIPSDVVIGPVDNSGQDVIFVNSDPAVILQATSSGQWTTLYTAPNDSLHFEASVRFAGDSQPEILTNDPSYIRNSPTRYFTSYNYRDGQLYRNWRVFHTNITNVRPVAFTPGGPQYLVTTIYGTGTLLVLKPQSVPLVPITVILLGLAIIGGWWFRFVSRGRKEVPHA